MEQHPIPQQISSYEFKLVGDMTLKQFGKAAAGIILALLINSTKLFFLIKWLLILISAGGGLLLAFVPFQDRPLENWIFSFIKSIYSPTIYTYKKKGEKTAKVGENLLNPLSPPDLSSRELAGPKRKTEFERQQPIKVEEIKNEYQTLRPAGGRGTSLDRAVVKKEETEPIEDWVRKPVDLDLKSEKLEATGKVLFGAIPMPDIPETPNIVVGMVTDNDGKIIEGAIVEIQDEHGNPSRVLKTNPLGQFRTSTQLINGRYLLICEKDNYKFDRVNIDVKGEIIEPIKLIAAKV